jgi:hypothetical protein
MVEVLDLQHEQLPLSNTQGNKMAARTVRNLQEFRANT